MRGHHEMRQQRLSLAVRRFLRRFGVELRGLPRKPVRAEIGKKIQLLPPRGVGASVGEIDDDALPLALDRGVRLIDEAREPLGQPVVAARLPSLAVHALLHDDPAPIVGDDEAVQIEIEAVLHRGAVDLRDEPARPRQSVAVEADAIADRDEFAGRLARMRAASAADMEPEFARQGREAALQRADDGSRDAGRMPVHAHDRAEGLEPEGMGEAAQEFVAAVFEDDRLGDHGAEPRHALAEPLGHAAVMQRQVGATSAARHQWSAPVVIASRAGRNRGARDRKPERRAAAR